MPTTVSDEVLVASCLEGDRKSQELLYRRFANKMYAVCLRYEPDKEKANDILQDAFIKVFKGLHAFKGEGSFEGWVRRIVVRTALDSFRKQSRLYVIGDYDEIATPSVQAEAVDKIGAEELMGLVQSLSPGYRTVFSLYAIDGYQHKEISEMLGISEGTSKSQYSRARVALQQLVERQSPGFFQTQQKKYETA